MKLEMPGLGSRSRLALISDTHGILHPEVLQALRALKPDLILHAGDVGPPSVLELLALVAPVLAVGGNADVVTQYRLALDVEIEDIKIHVSHGHEFPRVWLATPERMAKRYPSADIIVFGHTHRALVKQVGSTLVVNPGVAGPYRRRCPTIAVLDLAARQAAIVEVPR